MKNEGEFLTSTVEIYMYKLRSCTSSEGYANSESCQPMKLQDLKAYNIVCKPGLCGKAISVMVMCFRCTFFRPVFNNNGQFNRRKVDCNIEEKLRINCQRGITRKHS